MQSALRARKHTPSRRVNWGKLTRPRMGEFKVAAGESILKHKLDMQPLTDDTKSTLPLAHDNVRGPGYYH